MLEIKRWIFRERESRGKRVIDTVRFLFLPRAFEASKVRTRWWNVKAVATPADSFRASARMARVLVVLHPNNELRNAQRVGIHDRLPLSFFFSLSLPRLSFSLLLSLFTETGKAGRRVQTNITWYYAVRARAPVALDRKREEELCCVYSRRPDLGVPRRER